MFQLSLILDNLRSAANVGSILRTCDSAGILQVLACGSTPYPRLKIDSRDPVVINRNQREIAKTALGAEQHVKIEYFKDSMSAIDHCRQNGRAIYALEITQNAQNIFDFKPLSPAALIVGNEVGGLSQDVINKCDEVLQIPQRGSKESLNVAVATGIALYALIK